MLEQKITPHYIKNINGRSVTGVFSVYGNLDSYNDIMWSGSFEKTVQERGDQVIHLWQHEFFAPPIAKVDDLTELSREELPADILQRAPNAIGGMQVTRTYFDTPRGNEVLTILKAGSPLQMSFAFEPVKFDFEEQSDGMMVRNVREVRLYETSDVLWGANDATTASKASLTHALSHVNALLKAGARHNQGDKELLKQIYSILVDLGLDLSDENNDTDADAEQRAADLALTMQRAKQFLNL